MALTDPYDILIIGAGINGAGIARDAAGRGLSVALVESGDIGGATSSASTKLIHGGLRYLEYHAYGLVRKALAEREVLLDAAPHISWPQSFVLPKAAGSRPAWMLRAGLFLYDHLARRHDVPGSSRVDLHNDRAGRALANRDALAFRYWDGWVDDARLVIANCQDAAARGATVLPRTAAVSAHHDGSDWAVTLSSGTTLRARRIINAAGPWAEDVARRVLGFNDAPALKLVQGTHIVTKRIHLGRDAFMLQQPDGRIVFVIPYEHDFSLIGTTERTIATPEDVRPTEGEIDYLLAAANRWLTRPLTRESVLHSFAGVRPLVLEPGKGESETTRDWQLVHHQGSHAISVIGGKLTTYRLLAEDVLGHVPSRRGKWTAGVPLPGGDVPRQPGERGQAAFRHWLEALIIRHEHYDPHLIKRLAYTLGTACVPLLDQGLGARIGGMWEAELRHYAEREWASCADDVIWRRTKMGLRLSAEDVAEIADWFAARRTG
ncbi:MAG: glycerol-3-phosphate dehydrogenase [Polymorphobacter sp.]|uniref:glycerol-3-phosphate dehydrogenase n=1 Tax=Polymorphobacter sp. TaxID=1909290 RepID=UPI003A89D9AC